MSQQKRATSLSKVTGISYQKALMHLQDLELPLDVEKFYVATLEKHARLAESQCHNGHVYFGPVDGEGKFLRREDRRFIVGQDRRDDGWELVATWCPVCDRVNEMTHWFFEAYKDPADGVPYDGREGGYQYVGGGPYEPEEELSEHFPDATQVMMEAAVAKITPYGWEWVKQEQY
jgi:thiol-disulfide isomerase/thioredoxin